ncbi:hypothetical protein G4Y79_05285 [Phototrophicus methaneseepsis]|uniref:Uncharacterized protein n=1 Tax=Phototrophicus methaneseepsis TaxID=2710758 RepID=A0A7S8EBG6_9CHLR|nr:hypothetical protein [Phototrophicus methaneseepsis]QPC83794.1 hypothetical protein G4Y79_05285 [Phototrophicus methaneseepsis]
MTKKVTPTTSSINDTLTKRLKRVPTADEVLGTGTSEPIIRAPVPRRTRNAIQQIPQDAIVSRDDGTLSIGKFIMSGYGLEVPEDATAADFETFFTVMFKIRDRINLWIGDALAAFESLKYGYADEIADFFGYEPATIRNMKYVCTSVELSRRRYILAEVSRMKPDVEPLTMSHYDAIKALRPETQDELMRRALLEGLSSKALRAEVKALISPDTLKPSPFQRNVSALEKEIQDSLKLAKTKYNINQIRHLAELHRKAADQLESLTRLDELKS